MPSEFRPSSPSDGPELVALAERLLRLEPGHPMFAERHLHWKYWAAWQSSSMPRSHVLVRDGRIVAHAGVLPLACRASGRTLTVLHPFDWISEPKAIGSGAALLQRLAKLAHGLLIVGGSETTRRMVGPLGFRALGEVTCYAAPLDAGYNELDRLAADSPGSRSTTAADCEGAAAPAPWLTFLHPPERLQECTDCPATPMSVHTLTSDGKPSGGFVLAFAPGQARIAAFWCRSGRIDDYIAVIRLARREAAARAGSDEVVAMANVPVEQQALVAAGFRTTGSVPIFLLAAARDIDASARMGFQMLDGDVAFLHHGTPQPWL
jgi:hypothetical protein